MEPIIHTQHCHGIDFTLTQDEHVTTFIAKQGDKEVRLAHHIYDKELWFFRLKTSMLVLKLMAEDAKFEDFILDGGDIQVLVNYSDGGFSSSGSLCFDNCGLVYTYDDCYRAPETE